jgi:hypothetical protein
MRLPIGIRSVAVFTSLFLFVLIGFAFIPQAGIEDDEAMIVSGMYGQAGIAKGIEMFGYGIPLMLMSYVGALKSWIYTPIFLIWEPSAVSLRVPVICFGCLTIWLFYRLLLRIAGPRAAILGCVLLSTDTLFLLTACFDWGPVVLQHLLLVAGVLCVVRFHQESRLRFFAAGFLLFGLALWDKAVFAWILTGMAIAAPAVFPKEFWKCLRPRNVAVAALAFFLGAAPLIFYNICFPLYTFRSNAVYSTRYFPEKWRTLSGALSGQSLFGYLARVDPAGHSRNALTAIERASVRLSELAGHPVSAFFGYAVLAALLLLPVLWLTPARRPILFSAITMLVAWLQMLVTSGAGTAAHHVVLLWPFPVVVAVAFAEVSRMLGRVGNPLAAAVLLLLASTNALVTNEYFALLVRNGGGVVWTDAIYPLSNYLSRFQSQVIYITDWGIFDIVRMLNEGDLRMQICGDTLSKPNLDAADRSLLLDRISEKGAIFAGHTEETEMLKGVNATLRTLAVDAGYQREMLAQIADRNGRAIFQVFRFTR